MRKFIVTAILSVPLSFVTSIHAFSASQVQVAVDGQYVSFPDELPYIDDQSNRILVPARFVTEELGGKVQWNGQKKQVTFTYQDQIIILTIGQDYAQVDGKRVAFDVPVLMKNNRTMVPLRFISEIFGAKVEWMGEHNQVNVTIASHQASARMEKGTWIWDAQIIRSEQERILDFARENGLTSLYLHIDRDMKPEDYQKFIRRATSLNIRIEALAGKPYWAFRDHQARIEEFIIWVKDYNASVDPQGRFQGLHLDIEPYILEEWKTENKRVMENWMDNMRFIEKETKGTGLNITVDVPFWIYRTKIPESDYTFSAWLLEKVDGLVIMDYRNFSLGNNGIISNANPIMREAASLQKQAIIAVETAPSMEGDHTTFHSMSTEAMEEELRIAKKELSRYTSFAGFAIHDYKNWRELDEKSKQEGEIVNEVD